MVMQNMYIYNYAHTHIYRYIYSDTLTTQASLHNTEIHMYVCYVNIFTHTYIYMYTFTYIHANIPTTQASLPSGDTALKFTGQSNWAR